MPGLLAKLAAVSTPVTATAWISPAVTSEVAAGGVVVVGGGAAVVVAAAAVRPLTRIVWQWWDTATDVSDMVTEPAALALSFVLVRMQETRVEFVPAFIMRLFVDVLKYNGDAPTHQNTQVVSFNNKTKSLSSAYSFYIHSAVHRHFALRGRR